jgi:hypothetical protein
MAPSGAYSRCFVWLDLSCTSSKFFRLNRMCNLYSITRSLPLGLPSSRSRGRCMTSRATCRPIRCVPGSGSHTSSTKLATRAPALRVRGESHLAKQANTPVLRRMHQGDRTSRSSRVWANVSALMPIASMPFRSRRDPTTIAGLTGAAREEADEASRDLADR